jgi:hypothetical protein
MVSPDVSEQKDVQMNVLISHSHGQNTVEVKNHDFEKRIMGNRKTISLNSVSENINLGVRKPKLSFLEFNTYLEQPIPEAGETDELDEESDSEDWDTDSRPLTSIGHSRKISQLI